MQTTNPSYAAGSEAAPRLSLCMIVRNEDAFIRDCLESVRGVVDEMIVVDTGSTDDTIEICRLFGATVLTYAWGDDFAAARNHGLAHATGDWILWLDADEVVEPEDVSHLQAALCSDVSDLFTIHLINYCGETANLDESFQMSALRLFRNHQGIRFQNRIHESLNVSDAKHAADLPVRVYHYGYMPSVLKRKSKHARNIQLLTNELKQTEYSPWIHYHLAAEYYNVGQFDLALKHLDVGILRFVLSARTPPSMCYRLKYTILLLLEQAERALSTIDKAIAMYPDYVDLHFIKGLLLMQQKGYEEAEAVFGTCISLGEDNWSYLTLKGAGSFRAWHYRGICLERTGQLEDAQRALERSLSISPSFRASSDILAALRQRMGIDP